MVAAASRAAMPLPSSLSNLEGGRGNWRARRQGPAGSYTSPELVPAGERRASLQEDGAEARRPCCPQDTTYTEPQRLHKVLAAAGIGSRRRSKVDMPAGSR